MPQKDTRRKILSLEQEYRSERMEILRAERRDLEARLGLDDYYGSASEKSRHLAGRLRGVNAAIASLLDRCSVVRVPTQESARKRHTEALEKARRQKL